MSERFERYYEAVNNLSGSRAVEPSCPPQQREVLHAYAKGVEAFGRSLAREVASQSTSTGPVGEFDEHLQARQMQWQSARKELFAVYAGASIDTLAPAVPQEMLNALVHQAANTENKTERARTWRQHDILFRFGNFDHGFAHKRALGR